jgi:hypothetical protein
VFTSCVLKCYVHLPSRLAIVMGYHDRSEQGFDPAVLLYRDVVVNIVC